MSGGGSTTSWGGGGVQGPRKGRSVGIFKLTSQKERGLDPGIL